MTDFDQFVKDFKKHLAEATGIPIELLFKRPSTDPKDSVLYHDLKKYREHWAIKYKKMPQIDPSKDKE